MLIRLPQQRTTAISERRMCILKRSQLGTVNIFSGSLGKEAFIEEFRFCIKDKL